MRKICNPHPRFAIAYASPGELASWVFTRGRTAQKAALLYALNGWPGVGRFSIAKEMIEFLDSHWRFSHSYTLVDPAQAILSRGDFGYKNLRKRRIRSSVLDFILKNICEKLQLSSPIFCGSRRCATCENPRRKVHSDKHHLHAGRECQTFDIDGPFSQE